MNRILIILVTIALMASRAKAQVVNWESEPICYSDSVATRNPVARLQTAMDQGHLRLDGVDPLSRLRSLLDHLRIPVSSQVTVFSKTSLQKQQVSPAKPRAIYFNDTVFVGYVQNGLIEIATADPDLGAVFYTIDPNTDQPTGIQRQADRCLSCHGAARTGGVPGFQVRSVFPNAEGTPVIRAGSSLSTHRSPLIERWGGWYVTGSHGTQHHLGGYVLRDKKRPPEIDNRHGENQRSLPHQVDSSKYLTDSSDIVALMVMEHQVQAYNLLTQANFETRHAIWEADGRPLSDAQRARISEKVRPLVDYLRFVEEIKLESPVVGTSTFRKDFEAMAASPRETRLRQFDMRTRMFNQPLSYLVNTDTFAQVHPLLREAIADAIWQSVPNQSELRRVIKECGPSWLATR